MKNDQKYFVFAGDILDRTSETIGPLFIHVEATGEGCTLADAAQYLLQKLQDNNNTVVWLVPVDKEDEEKYLGIIDNADSGKTVCKRYRAVQHRHPGLHFPQPVFLLRYDRNVQRG